MKKIFSILAMFICLIASAESSDAQPGERPATAIQGSKFTDNWSASFGAGVATPLAHHSFFGSSRGIINASLTKYLTPAFGFGFNAEASFNTSSWYGNRSHTAIDHSYVGAYLAANLMNTFAGYCKEPRQFEMELTTGLGWLHAYNPKNVGDGNSWGARLGLNFNFNLGQTKAWTIGLRPAILWNVGGASKFYSQNIDSEFARFNANEAAFELLAGVTYHFGNSNGTRSFNEVQLYNPIEINQLNSQINGLRDDLEKCTATSRMLQAKASSLRNELDACNRRPAVVKEVSDNLNNIRYIFFNAGSAIIQQNQLPNLELIANVLKANPKATVTIKGYASPEGSAELNRRLSIQRAEKVKTALITTYKISGDRITTQGLGVGEIFNVRTWNRVAVCTIEN